MPSLLVCITDRQLLGDFIYSMASKARKLPLLTKPILMHKGGNGTGIVTCNKNRLYLRKKSFFARFFAHRTGREETHTHTHRC